MTFDQLIQTTGEWLRGGGTSSDVVVSSRIRLARNLAGYPFLTTASTSERSQIYRNVAEAISATPVGREAILFDLETADPLDREVLVERNLISRQHLAAEGTRGVSITPDETRSLMINEEDHLRIQVLRSGMDLETLWEDINALDDALARELPFAYDRQLGYLTACPTNVGTGIRVSVMLHLPALKLAREIERVARAARDLRLAVRGAHGEGTEVVGDLYQLSNQTTLGKSEPELIRAFTQKIVPQIVEYERKAREALVRHSPTQLEDKIWRAYGILANARRIGSEETQALLSPLRMGHHMGRFTLLDLNALNEIFLLTQPAHLQKICGKRLDDDERDVARADYLRQKLAQKRGES